MQVTDIVNLVIEKVAKKYNIKEDDVSWHKIAIELAYMYKEVKYSQVEITDPFQVSLLDQIEEKEEICSQNEGGLMKKAWLVDEKGDWLEVYNKGKDDDFKSNKLVKSKNVIEKTFSKDVLNCYRVCLDYFPEHLHPKRESIVKSWYSTIDKLNRIDKVPFSEIERITKLAREDEFTSKNIFHSLTKLRKKPKGEDIYWIVKWSEKFKPKTKTVNRQSEETIKKNIDGW